MSLDFSFELPYLDPSPSVHSALKAADELQAYLDMHGDDCHKQSLLQNQVSHNKEIYHRTKAVKDLWFFSRNKSLSFFLAFFISLNHHISLLLTLHDKSKQK